MVKPENVVKKIDSLGRVTIPKGVRNRLGINDGDELEIYTMEENGRVYICMRPARLEDPRIEIIREYFSEKGLELPEELK